MDHAKERIGKTYRNSLGVALLFSLANIPLTLKSYLSQAPVIASSAFAMFVLILFVVELKARMPADRRLRLVFILSTLVYLTTLSMLAAPQINLHFYLLPIVGGSVFLLSDSRFFGTAITVLSLAAFLGISLGGFGGYGVVGPIPPEELVMASKMNIIGAGTAFVLIMLLVTREYARSERNLDAERRKNAALLRSLYPESILPRMIAGETYIAENHPRVAVLFCDMVGFTTLSRSQTPADLVSILNRLYTSLDKTAAAFGVEKIKTIGDSYMAVTGISTNKANPEEAMAQFAQAVLALVGENFPELAVRTGIHSGPVIAGILGQTRQSYDIWGETVNLASRLEANAQRNQILCSSEFAARLPRGLPVSIIGEIELKGIGPTQCFEVIRHSNRQSPKIPIFAGS